VTDCSVFPARQGFVDILGLLSAVEGDIGWTAAVAREAGYLWFSLRNPRQLPMTLMWMENRGRHGSPWNGRNCCVGLEEICGYFAEGLPASARDNPLEAEGIPTAVMLSSDTPTRIPYVEGVARIPEDFGRVDRIAVTAGEITVRGTSGATIVLRASRLAAVEKGDLRIRWD
jgi:hypothetical protein